MHLVLKDLLLQLVIVYWTTLLEYIVSENSVTVNILCFMNMHMHFWNWLSKLLKRHIITTDLQNVSFPLLNNSVLKTIGPATHVAVTTKLQLNAAHYKHFWAFEYMIYHIHSLLSNSYFHDTNPFQMEQHTFMGRFSCQIRGTWFIAAWMVARTFKTERWIGIWSIAIPGLTTHDTC